MHPDVSWESRGDGPGSVPTLFPESSAKSLSAVERSRRDVVRRQTVGHVRSLCGLEFGSGSGGRVVAGGPTGTLRGSRSTYNGGTTCLSVYVEMGFPPVGPPRPRVGVGQTLVVQCWISFVVLGPYYWGPPRTRSELGLLWG